MAPRSLIGTTRPGVEVERLINILHDGETKSAVEAIRFFQNR